MATKTFSALMREGIKGERKVADVIAAIFAQFLAPLANPQGLIDRKAAPYKALVSDARKVATAHYIETAPHVIDGVLVSADDIRKALADGSKAKAVREGAMTSIRVIAYRWTDKIVKDKAAQAQGDKAERAPHGKVAVAFKRSAAAKGGKAKAAQAKATQDKAAQAALSIPQQAEQLRAALMALSPQSRIVQATAIVNMAQGIVREARVAIDAMPKQAKAPRVRRGAKVADPVATVQ